MQKRVTLVDLVRSFQMSLSPCPFFSNFFSNEIAIQKQYLVFVLLTSKTRLRCSRERASQSLPKISQQLQKKIGQKIGQSLPKISQQLQTNIGMELEGAPGALAASRALRCAAAFPGLILSCSALGRPFRLAAEGGPESRQLAAFDLIRKIPNDIRAD